MPEEEQLLTSQNPIYNCNNCEQPAQHPVLPPCGHLYWYVFVHAVGDVLIEWSNVMSVEVHSILTSFPSLSITPITNNNNPCLLNLNLGIVRGSETVVVFQGILTLCFEIRIICSRKLLWQVMDTVLLW